ncbi:MAG: hypothetical protein ACKVVP_21260 [Chloroflexota bacterium]
MFGGLLWFDKSSKRTPREKLDMASARFRARLGKAANRCFVHPGEEFEHPEIGVFADPSVLPGYLWVGSVTEEVTDGIADGRSSRKLARRRSAAVRRKWRIWT